MASATAAGTLLAADAADRTLTYRLLPYGEPGRTNLGRVTAAAGAVTIPDRLVANLEHDARRPVAWADRSDIRETPTGLEATFHVAETTAGNDLLVEARSGLRAGVSVEVDPIVVRNGRIVSGTLNGAGFVTAPAFASARLVAEDAGELDEDEDDTTEPPAEGDEDPQTEQDPEPPAEGDDPESEATVPNATATAPAGGLAASRRPNKDTGISRSAFFGLMADAYRSGGHRGLAAALADVVPANVLGIEQPQYVGELWDGKAYTRKFVPLVNHASLTSFTVTGWEWITRPVVAPYTGNKTEVPSNAIETAPVTIEAERIAGAHDIDRKFRDFGDNEFWDAYFRAMTESYARVSDVALVSDLLAAAPAVTAGTVPTDVPAGLAYIVDGALAILEETDTMPTFALVAPSLWRDIVLSPVDHTLEYLSSAVGLDSGSMAGFQLIPTANSPIDGVLVGTKDAATFHELGETPIRVEAPDVANGGIDAGVFGYYATNVHDAAGLAAVVAGTP
jgi:hypothetical protein